MKIPFNSNGHLVSYVERHMKDVEWVECYEFETKMEIDSMSRGRSSATFNLVSAEGHHYSMFMVDCVNMMKTGTICKGAIYGKWTFCKRGQNYGVKLVVS